MRRGEIWWAELPPPVDSRPVVILTRDAVLHSTKTAGNQCGFNRFNRLFDGRMEEVLGELHEAVWSA